MKAAHSVKALTGALLLLSSLIASLATQAQVSYTVTSLGSQTTGIEEPTAINSRGEIIGSNRHNNHQVAAVWRNGVLTRLPTLPDLPESTATSINDVGQIVGYCRNSSGIVVHACLWQDGVVTPTLIPGWSNSMAQSINGRGHILISASNGSTQSRDEHPTFFLWIKGKVVPLPLPREPLSLNDSDQILLGSFQATVWKSGHLILLNGFPSGGDSYGLAMNAAGMVVGEALAPLDIVSGRVYPAVAPSQYSPPTLYDNFRACLWQNGTITNLGMLPSDQVSEALGVNNMGQVVGDSGQGAMDGPMAPITHAVLWNKGAMINLQNAIGGLPRYRPGLEIWELSRALGIDNSGQIIGTGVLQTQRSRSYPNGFLLTPIHHVCK